MKHLTLERAIIICLLILVVWQMCSEPKEQVSPVILELENSIRHRDLKIDSLVKANTATLDDNRKDSLEHVKEKVSFKTALNRFEKKLAVNKPKVMEQIDSLPIVKAYIEDLDSISDLKDNHIHSLEYLYGKLQVNMTVVVDNFERQLEEMAGKLEDQKKISAEWKKESEKKGKGGRGWRAVAVVGSVVGLIVGANL